MRVRTVVSLLAIGLFLGCGEAPSDEPSAPPTPIEGVFGQAPAAVGGIPSVISIEPHIDAAVPEVSGVGPTIDQIGLMFAPRRRIVRLGESVRFTNSESIAHNVHIRSIASDSTVYNEDTLPNETVTIRLEREGGYDVLCDTHPGMTAFIFVTSAPHSDFAADDGAYHLSGMAPGEYTLRIWSVDPTMRSEQSIVVREGSATEGRQ